jgi:hypothetical protein
MVNYCAIRSKMFATTRQRPVLVAQQSIQFNLHHVAYGGKRENQSCYKRSPPRVGKQQAVPNTTKPVVRVLPRLIARQPARYGLLLLFTFMKTTHVVYDHDGACSLLDRIVRARVQKDSDRSFKCAKLNIAHLLRPAPVAHHTKRPSVSGLLQEGVAYR